MKHVLNFEGTLRLSDHVKTEQVVFLNYLLNDDWREQPHRENPQNLSYIPLYLNEDCSALIYVVTTIPGGKDIDMVEAVNSLLEEMKVNYPDFGLKGSLVAQTENEEDRWELYIGQDGYAHKRILQQIECPHCGGDLSLKKGFSLYGE